MKCPHNARGTLGREQHDPSSGPSTCSIKYAPGDMPRWSHHSITGASEPQVCTHHQGTVQAQVVGRPISDSKDLSFRTYYTGKQLMLLVGATT